MNEPGESRGARVSVRPPGRAPGAGWPRADRGVSGGVPLRYWALWWSIFAAAVVVFYVLLTPIWLGLRAAAWGAELRSRARRRT